MLNYIKFKAGYGIPLFVKEKHNRIVNKMDYIIKCGKYI